MTCSGLHLNHPAELEIQLLPRAKQNLPTKRSSDSLCIALWRLRPRNVRERRDSQKRPDHS